MVAAAGARRGAGSGVTATGASAGGTLDVRGSRVPAPRSVSTLRRASGAGRGGPPSVRRGSAAPAWTALSSAGAGHAGHDLTAGGSVTAASSANSSVSSSSRPPSSGVSLGTRGAGCTPGMVVPLASGPPDAATRPATERAEGASAPGAGNVVPAGGRAGGGGCDARGGTGMNGAGRNVAAAPPPAGARTGCTVPTAGVGISCATRGSGPTPVTSSSLCFETGIPRNVSSSRAFAPGPGGGRSVPTAREHSAERARRAPSRRGGLARHGTVAPVSHASRIALTRSGASCCTQCDTSGR